MLFAFILTLGAGFFALNVQRLVRYMRIAQGPDDRTDGPLVRLRNVLTIGIAQTKIFRDPIAGAMHATIFWGFMVLTAGTVEILIQGVFSGFTYERILPRPLYLLYSLFWGKDAPANPWGAVGLEWTTSSPPPTENFEEQPIVTWEAYEFSRKEPDVVRASPNDTSTPV